MLFYYEFLLGLSICFTLIYAYIWHKRFDVNITLIFLLVPLSNLANVAVARSENINEAILGTKITYITGCFTILFIMFTILELCHFTIPKALQGSLVAVSMLLYLPVLTIGDSDIFYKSVDYTTKNGVSMLTGKEYGVFHTILYVWIFICFAVCIISLIYSHIRRNDVSHKIIYLLIVPVIVAMVSFFGGRMITKEIELIPAAYVFSQIFYLLIAYKLELYDINDSGLESLVQKGDTGFISIDFRLRYLGSNETAKEWLPFLKDLHVDSFINKDPKHRETILSWIQQFNEGKIDKDNQIHYRSQDGERVFLVDVNHLYDAQRRQGYQIFITDDTADIKYIEFQEKFTTVLRFEVDQKTERIRQMNDHLLFSMATMVESRDPFTGGHIRRTSEGVRMLIEQMEKDNVLNLSKKFGEYVIKAAPMHDIGKIAVPDSVLLKPGRYEPEEYEIMKSHSAEGARVVSEILKDTDDEDFKRIAINVAHYHHERWDGNGYPDKLSGHDIPLEARIMAIADVYDALVSKRVYKAKMPFEKADAIIMEGMGTQFDPSLEKYYVAARPQFEAYYESQLNEDATQHGEHPEVTGEKEPGEEKPAEEEK